jgi:hypothetical protein
MGSPSTAFSQLSSANGPRKAVKAWGKTLLFSFLWATKKTHWVFGAQESFWILVDVQLSFLFQRKERGRKPGEKYAGI